MSEHVILAFAARLDNRSEEQIERIDYALVRKIARKVAEEATDVSGNLCRDFGNFGMGRTE